MFKSMIHSINGHSKATISGKAGIDEATSVSVNCSNLEQDVAQKQSSKNIGKRSRKKLFAMMDRIHSSMNNGKKSAKSKENGDQNNNNNGTANIASNNDIQSDDDHFFDLDLDEGDEFEEGETDEHSNAKEGHLLPEEQEDIPTFLHTKNCDQHLIEETRKLLKDRYAKNPDSFYDDDYKRMLADDWTVTRFLLRRRLDPKRTAKLMEECGQFRKQYKMSEIKLHEFPIEFHKAGGLFKYAPDRVGNITVYMRVKMYRRVPEISDVFKAFILCVLEEADVANGGRGTSVIFDLSGCGLQNVDLSFLSWLLSSFRNYCPKGVGYILVYNLPWILNATCKLAMTWMSASNRRALRFVHGDEILHFIAKENLPDYCGGTCKINYRHVPEGALPATEVCERLDMTREQALKIRELFKEYLDENDYKKSAINQSNGASGDGENEILADANNQAKLMLQASKFIA